jgi:hypothetical protein
LIFRLSILLRCHVSGQSWKSPAFSLPIINWLDRSRSLTAGFLAGLQFRARQGITMSGSAAIILSRWKEA